jgi:ElaB/YqjD/DUF883 family membrane-anchored ribosome-binding protein
MATTETARLERETEQTRAQLESTLFELRARMSPGTLMDQATDYLRSSSGRMFVTNLRDQVVENPVPVTLIGAGIAWLALSGALSRRSNGDGRADMERDWDRTGATAYGMAHNGGRRSAAQRARDAAEGWAEDARETASGAGEAMREGMDDLRERAGTMYDETMGRARQRTEDWAEDAREAASQAGGAVREGVDAIRERAGEVRERAAGMYDETVGRARHMAHKAADYGRAARHAVQSDGALMTFCREQPMLVAGIGIAVGAALGALIPASRTETRVMGEASREMRERATQAAAETLRAATNGGDRNDGSNRGDGDRAGSQADRAAYEVERGVEQANRRPNTETEPQSAPYAEAAEADTASAPTTETRQPN